MGGGAYLKETHQRPLTPGFNEIKRVSKPYLGTHGGPG